MFAVVSRWKTALRLQAVLVALGFVFGLCAGAYAADNKVEVRFSGYYPESYPVYKEGIKPWEELVEKEGNGKIVFKNYLNGVLNAAKHGFRATKDGICDLSHGYPMYQPASFNLCLFGDMPFIVSSSYSGVLAAESLYPKYLKKEYEKMGPYLGFWVFTSPYNLMSKKPVRTLDDLKGMKIRSTGGIGSDILKELGAVPVILQSAESYTSLQSGVVDAVLYPDGSFVSYRIYEIAKYHTSLAVYNGAVPYAMNRKFFDGLSPENKRFFYNKLRQAAVMASYAYDIDAVAAHKVLKENGVEMINLSEAEKERFRKAVAPMWERFIKNNEAKGLPAKQFVEEFRKLEKEFSKLTPEQALEYATKNPAPGIVDF